MILIRHAALVTPSVQAEETAVLLDGSRIKAAGHDAVLHAPADADVIDARGLLLVPGFIDLQLNGAFGRDFTADPGAIWPVSRDLARFGVTSYLPTIITSPLETVERARNQLIHGRPSDFTGAEPLGLHVEGPFLNPRKKGAHNPAYLRPPEETAVRAWSPAGGVRLVTLAPELPGALPLIEALASRGILVSAGHSTATYAEALAGFSAGIRYGTHLFNAMPAAGHREPGLPIALLTQPGLCTGLIADNVHVHPAMIDLVWRLKGPAGVNLVSDAMAALGMPPGVYALHDYAVTVTESECRLVDGALAGSVLSLDQALRNLITITGCSLADALATITTTPARLLGIADRRGDIAPGMIADLVLLTPDLRVHTTIAAGTIVSSQPAAGS